MEAWQDDDNNAATCGVKIAEKLPVHDDVFGGAFEVRMELGPPFACCLFGSGKNPNLTILSAKLHMKDELITRISGWSFILSEDKAEWIINLQINLKILCSIYG